MRAVIYARFSNGPRQTEQSIEGQVRVCTDFCKQKEFTVTEIYADRHISGKTDDRPEFQRLIADSKKKKFDAVVVYKTDRFARNKYDSAIYKRQLKQSGIKIYYAAEAIPDGPEGIILESLMEGLAEYYSAELSQKIARGLHESALKARVVGSAPIGYRIGKDRKFEIDPEGRKAVRMIFERYIAGDTCADICRSLNELGFRTSQGNLFNKNSLVRIIKNERYIGVYEASGIRIEDGVPAIVTKEEFYMAQQERAKRKGRKTNRNTTGDYLLSEKLFCGYCKKPMAGVSGTSKTGRIYYYYYCPTVRAKGNCQKKHVPKDDIEDLVVNKTVQYVLQPDVIGKLAVDLYDLWHKDDTREQDILIYRKKLAENEKASANLLKALESGLGSEMILKRLQALDDERKAINAELLYQEHIDPGMDVGDLIFMLTQYLKPDKGSWESYKKRIIKSFISKVYLYDDKLIIYYNIIKGHSQDFDELVLSGEFDRTDFQSTCRADCRTLDKILTVFSGVVLTIKIETSD